MEQQTDTQEEQSAQPAPESPSQPATTRKSAIFEPIPQAEINKKMIRRFAIAMGLLAILIAGYAYMRSLNGDIDFPATGNSAGEIAAIQYLDNGSQAVLMKPDGSILQSPDFVEGTNDRDITWRPDGNRIFFSGNRKEDVYQIYRWNPFSNRVAQRSLSSGASQPTFTAFKTEDQNTRALVLKGGFVLEFDPANASSHQILPPQGKGASKGAGEDNQGSASQFEQMYQSLGTSFKTAEWAFNKEVIVAVMRRDEGEVLIVQPMTEAKPPQAIAAGERIDLAIDPHDGSVVYSIVGFQIPDAASVMADPELRKQFVEEKTVTQNGVTRKVETLKKPFEHAVGMLTMDSNHRVQNAIIAPSFQKDATFVQPTVSPDGSMVAVILAEYGGSGVVTPKRLFVFPKQAGGYQAGTLVQKGDVHEPSWKPDSKGLLFAKTENGYRAIFSINRDGSEYKNLTGTKGNFGYPVYSPQTK